MGAENSPDSPHPDFTESAPSDLLWIGRRTLKQEADALVERSA